MDNSRAEGTFLERYQNTDFVHRNYTEFTFYLTSSTLLVPNHSLIHAEKVWSDDKEQSFLAVGVRHNSICLFRHDFKHGVSNTHCTSQLHDSL